MLSPKDKHRLLALVLSGITNNGAQSVAIRRATIYGGDVTVLSQSYDTTTVIGAGNRMTFSFTIKADVPPGVYYPYFSLDFRDAGYLRYPIPIWVDNQPLTLAVLNKPDVFSEGRKDRVDILVGNPRDNPVSGVVVNFLGSRMDPVPSSYFIGNLDPDQSRQVSVNITPEELGNQQVLVDYKNGINDHTDSLTLPVAAQVGEQDLAQGSLYPPLASVREVSAKIAAEVAEVAFHRGLAARRRPPDVMATVHAAMYEPTYKIYV